MRIDEDPGQRQPIYPDLPDVQQGWTQGVVRRVRRSADLSQRDLARLLGVAQSTVARWETGRRSLSTAQLEQLLALARLRLVLVDEVGRVIPPMGEDRVRDRARRRLPAHLDPYTLDWWTPRGADRTPFYVDLWRRARQLQDPGVRYQRRGFWRDVVRGESGIPEDHPTTELLRSTIQRRSRGGTR